MKITVDMVMSKDPCCTRKAVERLWAGRETLSLEEILNMDIPNADKAWVFSQFNTFFDNPFVWPSGAQEWYQNGKLHREDGPAENCANGYQAWYKNGKLHRDDGPATTSPDGSQEWYKNGKRHREDGPAVVYADGSQAWYQNGKRIKTVQL